MMEFVSWDDDIPIIHSCSKPPTSIRLLVIYDDMVIIWDDDIPNIWKIIHSGSKPPTSQMLIAA
jgi:hypothetical protein